MAENQKKSSSSSSSSSSSDQEKKQKVNYYQQVPVGNTIITQQPQMLRAQQQASQIVYGSSAAAIQTSQMQTLTTLPVGITEEQVRRSLAGVSLETIKGEVRSEYIPLTRVETEYKEEVQYEQIPRQVKVTDYYQVEYLQEKVPSVLQHTITEYVPQQKIIPQVNYKAIEKTYTRPEIIAGDVRIEQGAMEIVSSQIIQTESQAHTIAYPQIATTNTVSYTQPQMAQYTTTVMQGKKKSSSVKYKKAQMITASPIRVQSPQMQTFVQGPVQVQRSFQTATQVIPGAVQFAQPTMQRMQMTSPVAYQTQMIPQQTFQTQMMPQQTFQTSVIPQQTFVNGSSMMMNQGMLPQNQFQGVRLADSHILAK